MIVFLIPIVIVVFGVIIFFIHNNKAKENTFNKQDNPKYSNWIKFLVIINICIICFFKFIFPGDAKYSEPTIFFYVSLLINIITIILVFNKKIVQKKIVVICTVVVYFLLMIILPVYKLDDHKHIFDNTRTHTYTVGEVTFTSPYEEIISYTNYYNCYGLKLYETTQ